MIAILALAAAAPPVERAERAFASAAQTNGQWTAFRAFAAPDAHMMIDGPQPAAPFLKDRKDPSQAVMWWPSHTVTSCDHSLAFSTGPWRRDGGRRTGRFFTIWRHDSSGWRWLFDGGADANASESRDGIAAGDTVIRKKQPLCRKPPPLPDASPPAIGGASDDGSLRWRVDPTDDKPERAYRLRVLFSTGRGWNTVADEIVG